MGDLDDKLKKTIESFSEAEENGSGSAVAYKKEIAKLRKEIELEKRRKPPLHPSLQFGPLAQTVACMAVISLGLGTVGPLEGLEEFAVTFTRLTIVAVVSLVSYSSVIYYGYSTALAAAEAEKAKSGAQSDAEIKLAKLLKSKADRPDKWAHTRSHPSAFLTTRLAEPRIFPFPLGKARSEVAVQGELWWEGGNAPHVGHFNRPKLPPPPPALDETTLVERVKKSMEIESQREMWAKRIRGIQMLSVIVVVYFLNQKIAMIGLLYLVYTTIAREVDAMLKPPTDWGEVYKYIDQISMTGARNASAPKSNVKKGIPPGGMTYIYDPISASTGVLDKNSDIPIVPGPAPVLMTTVNHWYAGP